MLDSLKPADNSQTSRKSLFLVYRAAILPAPGLEGGGIIHAYKSVRQNTQLNKLRKFVLF